MITLLMVDDEHLVRERFAFHVPWKEAGIRFLGAAGNGAEALHMMEREEPHILLTDITMPIMDGMELAKEVKKRYPRVRIVFLTVYSEFDYMRQAIVLGIRDYLLKAGLSTAQLLEACGRLASEIETEAISERIQRAKEEAESRRVWLEAFLDGERWRPQAQADRLRQMAIRDSGLLAAVWLGWNVYPSPSERAMVPEEHRELQLELWRIAEETAKTCPGVTVHAYPYNRNRLVLLAQAPQSAGGAHFHSQLYMVARDVLSAIGKQTTIASYAYVSATTTIDELRTRLIDNRERQALFFYKPYGCSAEPEEHPFRPDDALAQAEWAGKMAKSLHISVCEELYEAVDQLTSEQHPPYAPAFLIGTAKQMVGNALSGHPQLRQTLLNRLELVEKWSDYRDWWQFTLQLFVENGLISERIAVRKEVRHMLGLIHEQYARNISLVDAAAIIHLNPTYAGQLFKKETGQLFTDYLNRYRIDKAVELFKVTPLKIYEVAQAVGIRDYRYFCRLFKNTIGVTPRAFKRGL